MLTKGCIIDGGKKALGLSPRSCAGEPRRSRSCLQPTELGLWRRRAREALRWEEGVFLASGQPPSGCTSAIAEQEGQLEVAQLHPCTAQMGFPTPREVKQITHRSNQKSGRNQVQLHSFISLHYFLELKLLPK